MKILTHTCRKLKPPKVVLEYWLRGVIDMNEMGKYEAAELIPQEDECVYLVHTANSLFWHFNI